MNILLTNDDGYFAPGIAAAHAAIKELGNVHVVAPASEKSACSHSLSLRVPIHVDVIEHPQFGRVHAVEGTPADCVRLAIGELLPDVKIDLVVSGMNRGANIGVDTFYSGTVAGAREGTILGIKAVALSHAVRRERDTNWAAASAFVGELLPDLLSETMPTLGFWNVNLPPVLPENPHEHVHRVPVARETVPLDFIRSHHPETGVLQFQYGSAYWDRHVSEPSDFSVVRDGGIAVTAIPLAVHI